MTEIRNTQQQLAPIVTDAVYRLPDFMQRTGLGKAAIRGMRKSGFVVRRIGRRSYVWGKEFHDWFSHNAEPIGGLVVSP